MGRCQFGWRILPGPKRWRMGQRQRSASLRAERADRFVGCSGWWIDPVAPGYGACRDGMVARRSVAARIENLTDRLPGFSLTPRFGGVLMRARSTPTDSRVRAFLASDQLRADKAVRAPGSALLELSLSPVSSFC